MGRRGGHINLFFSRSTSSISHAWRSILRKPVGFHSWGHYPNANLGGRNWSMYSKVIKVGRTDAYAHRSAARYHENKKSYFFVSFKMSVFPFLPLCRSKPNAKISELTRNSSLNCVSRAVLYPLYFAGCWANPLICFTSLLWSVLK